MLLELTQDHIDNGEMQDCERCPWALCIKEAIGAEGVMVGDETVEVWIGIKAYQSIPLPQEMFQWIEQYDLEGPEVMRPMSVDLPLEEILEQILEPA